MKCSQCGNIFEGALCPLCGTSPVIQEPHIVNSPIGPGQPALNQINRPVYKKWWFWVIIAVVAVGTIVVLSNNSPSKSGDEQSGSLTASNTVNHTSTSENTSTDEDNKNTGVTVADFREMDRAAIQSWAEANNIDCKITEAYSDSAAKGSFISQSMNPGEIIGQGDTVEIVFSLGNKPSAEYENALKKAEMYAKTMHMSKQGVYDQLTSEYGENFLRQPPNMPLTICRLIGMPTPWKRQEYIKKPCTCPKTPFMLN